jgi:hypothetical protein
MAFIDYSNFEVSKVVVVLEEGITVAKYLSGVKKGGIEEME